MSAAGHARSDSPVVLPGSPNPAAAGERPIDGLIDHLQQQRDLGRQARGDLQVRHAEFGLVAMRVEASDGDVRATLSNRDPGFAPAVHAALSDRAITATADSQPTGQRGHEHSGQLQQQASSQQQSFSQQTSDRPGRTSEQPVAPETVAQDTKGIMTAKGLYA